MASSLGAIVARDTRPRVEMIAPLPGGDVLVIESTGLAAKRGRLVRRAAHDLSMIAELRGVDAPAVLSPDGTRLLAAGPLRGGEQSSAVIVDLVRWRIERTLPVMPPFAWLGPQRFIAQSPRWEYKLVDGELVRTGKRAIDPKIVAAAPKLLAKVHALVEVDLAKSRVRTLLPSVEHDEERHAVLAPAGDVVYTATLYGRISAVRIADGALVWQRPAVTHDDEGSVMALALRPGGELVAAGWGAHDVVQLDPATGRELARERLASRVRPSHRFLVSTAVRADGLVAIGSDRGVVITSGRGGAWTSRRIGTRSLDALAFVDGGRTLLAGGAEHNLRRLEL